MYHLSCQINTYFSDSCLFLFPYIMYICICVCFLPRNIDIGICLFWTGLKQIAENRWYLSMLFGVYAIIMVFFQCAFGLLMNPRNKTSSFRKGNPLWQWPNLRFYAHLDDYDIRYSQAAKKETDRCSLTIFVASTQVILGKLFWRDWNLYIYFPLDGEILKLCLFCAAAELPPKSWITAFFFVSGVPPIFIGCLSPFFTYQSNTNDRHHGFFLQMHLAAEKITSVPDFITMWMYTYNMFV